MNVNEMELGMRVVVNVPPGTDLTPGTFPGTVKEFLLHERGWRDGAVVVLDNTPAADEGVGYEFYVVGAEADGSDTWMDQLEVEVQINKG